MAAHLPPLDQSFHWLLRATTQLSAVILVILLARRALGGRISPGARYALWLLLALPLIAPLLPINPIPLPRSPRPPLPEVVVPNAPPPPVSTTGWRVIYEAAAVRPRPTVAEPPQPNRLRLFAVAWLTGAAALALRVTITHALAIRRARRSPPVTDATVTALLEDCGRAVRTRRLPRLVAAPVGTGPALIGVLRPRLLLPAGLKGRLSPNELRFVFLHELIHLKRADVLGEWLLTLLQVAHWFNPLVWLAASRCRSDREIACDAAVLALAGNAGRADYGRTILRLASELSAATRFSRALAPAVGILETHSPLERRLRMIAQDSHPRPARWAASAVVVLALAAVTCTNAQPAGKVGAAKPQAAKPTGDPKSAPGQPTGAPEARRERTADEEREYQRVKKNEQAEAQLDRQLPEVNFNNVAFTDVVDFLRDVSGAKVFVNWKALEAAGIKREATVSARLRMIPFRKALTVILDSIAGGGTTKLGFVVDEGVITISTDDDLPRDTLTRVYDLRDLVTPIPNFDFDADPAKEGDKAKGDAPGTTRAQAAEELMRLIRETVEPDRWGKFAQMRDRQGQLVVTATKEMHQSIAQLVEQLRDTRSLQVSVDARFIGADDDVLDALPDGLRQKVAGALHAAKEGAPHGRAAAGAAGDRDGRLQYLDGGEVEELLRVVRANRNAEFVAAPRITLFNGQTAYVLTATQRAYVADYKVVKQPDGKTAYEPTLATAQAGVLLRAGATTSADRKYATLTLHPRLTYLAGMDQARWRGNAPGEDLKVEVPNLLVSELGTTVSVPDGGTVLLGGLRGYVVADPDNARKEPRLQSVIMLVQPKLIVRREVEVAPSTAPEKKQRL
jgi:beta-lactamase regulating signal transducer with metallopeptidase domain